MKEHSCIGRGEKAFKRYSPFLAKKGALRNHQRSSVFRLRLSTPISRGKGGKAFRRENFVVPPFEMCVERGNGCVPSFRLVK